MRTALPRWTLGLTLASVAFTAAAGCDCSGTTGAEDASVDAFRVRVDSGPVDSGEDAGPAAMRDPDRCRIEPSDVYLLGTDSDVGYSSRVIGVAPAPTEFGVVWQESIEGTPQIRFAQIPSTEGDPVSQTVTDGTSLHFDPDATYTSSGYLVSWVDNSMEDLEVFVRSVGSSLGTPVRLTNRTGRDDSPALLTVSGSVIAAWVEQRDTTTRQLVTQGLGADGTLAGSSHDVPSATSVGRPVLGLREGGAAVLFVDSGNAYLERLDATGGTVGVPQELSTEHNAQGDIDVGMTSEDGASVFSALVSGVRRDVRVRRVDGTGVPSVAEYAMNGTTGSPSEYGDSASVVRLRAATGWSTTCRDGYAVVYRSYATSDAEPVLRLILLDAGAQLVRYVDLSPTDISSRGGRTTLRISGDGQLLVAWTDAFDDHVNMRAARVRCD